jgi:hypothetical protein
MYSHIWTENSVLAPWREEMVTPILKSERLLLCKLLQAYVSDSIYL